MARPNHALIDALAATEVLRQEVTELKSNKPNPASGTIVHGKSSASELQATMADQREAQATQETLAERRRMRDQDNADIDAARAAEGLPPIVRPQPIVDPLRPEPVNTFRDPGTAILRYARGPKQGQPYNADADTRPYTERRLSAQDAREAEIQAETAARNAGCPPGTFRDLTGLIRDARDGKVRTDLMPATYSPPPTELTAPAPLATQSAPGPVLIPPHIEEIAAGQDPDAVTDETAEILRLRRPDPVLIGGLVSPDRPVREVIPERPLSILEQIQQRS